MSEPHVCNAYYGSLLSNFFLIFKSSDDEKCKREGDVEVEVEVDEVDEK